MTRDLRVFTSRLPPTAMALLVGATSCKNAAPSDAVFELESSRVRELTTPAHAQVLELSPVNRQPLRLSQQWQLGDVVDWASFAAATQHVLSETYRCSSEARSLLCVRGLPGDHLELHFVFEARDRVRASLEARPD